ncbi:hypothetical protein EPI10_016382 [Gossypium australe]|uniref:Uncharacterized protein n=1 Tax=Gossypium australe TaxID=47621 RepID=A0A5B6VNQ0_9ROSI|nr:hypothetical protein EPI10_016382 [Gossypium australe]
MVKRGYEAITEVLVEWANSIRIIWSEGYLIQAKISSGKRVIFMNLNETGSFHQISRFLSHLEKGREGIVFRHQSEAVMTQQKARARAKGKRGGKREKKIEEGRVHIL